MRKIISLLLLVSLLTSCTQDILTADVHKVKGQEVTAHFTLSTAPMQQISINNGVTTRSTDAATVEDDKITDMWVVQFDNSGNYMKKEYFVNVNLAGFNPSLSVNSSGTTSTIYFLANIGNVLDTPDSESTFKTQMKSFTNDTQLLISADNGKKNVPLYAKLSPVTILASGYLDNMSVTLTRMLARVSIAYTITDNAYSQLSLETVRLCNVPTGLTFVPPTSAAGASATTSFSLQNLATEAVTASTGTLTFYIPENQRGEGTNSAAEHNERLKDGTGTSNATYVEFAGHTIGKRGGEKVTFRYYLGANNYNEYNVVRNFKYDITLSIDGVSPADRRFTIAAERANCYILKPGGTIEIPVLRANESDLGIQLPDVQAGWSAYVYWTTPTANLVTVSNTTASKGYFTVTAPNATNEGNALVAIKDGSNKVLWSWHIWVESEDITGTALPLTGGGSTWMDRNLGANQSGQSGGDYSTTAGFLYQWGRKDPFIATNKTDGSSTFAMFNAAGTAFTAPTYPFTTAAITGDTYTKFADLNSIAGQANALSYSVQYPMLFLGAWMGSSAKYPYNSIAGHDSWGGEFGQAKAVYDPCPAGWRVPSGERNSTSFVHPWGSLASPTGPTAPSGSAYAYYSSAVTQNGSTTSYIIQAMGLRNPGNGAFSSVGSGVYYWVATQNGNSGGRDLWGVSTFTDSSSKSYGEAIRCVKNWN